MLTKTQPPQVPTATGRSDHCSRGRLRNSSRDGTNDERPWYVRFPLSIGIAILLVVALAGSFILILGLRHAAHGAAGVLLVHETSRAVFMTLVMRRTPGSASGCNTASTSCDDLTLRTVTLDAPIGDRQLYSTTFN